MRYLLSILTVFLLISCGTESTPVYTLTTSVNGEGTITPSTGEYEEGETITLTGTPSEHWVFQNWSGDGSGSSNTITITMDSDKNVVGNFTERLYPLNITIEGEGSVDEVVVQSKSEYTVGTVVELTPIPSEGWKFESWSGGVTSTDEVVTVTVDGEMNVTVTFTGKIYLGENGITIMCPNSNVRDIGIVDDVEYEVVDNDLLRKRLEEGKGSFDRNVCVSLVTDMSQLFIGLQFNQDIGNWDVSSVRDMGSIFDSTPFNQDISEWNVSNVIDMSFMFWKSQFNQSIGDWDISNVIWMDGMFFQTNFNQDITDWDVSSVTGMSNLFSGSSFNQDIGDWNVSSVTNMIEMFSGSSFDQDIGDWDVSSVKSMRNMFSNSEFNQSIGNWDVSTVTDMSFMFSGSQFNQNISGWCVWRIGSEPRSFSTGSPLTEENKPVWGTCPD